MDNFSTTTNVFMYDTCKMVNAKDINDFSEHVADIIYVSDTTDWMQLANYWSSWSISNTFELTADVDFNGEESRVLSDNFRGTFNGNMFRLMNFNTSAFGTITTGVEIFNIIFYNFLAPAVVSVTGESSVASCVCCGTFSSDSGAFCSSMSGVSHTFENNAVLLSGASRIVNTSNAGCISSTASYNVTGCFVACTSDVYVHSKGQVGLISPSGVWSGQNAVNFNGYLSSESWSGGLIGECSDTALLNGAGGYSCGSGSTIAHKAKAGRLFGMVPANQVYELYHYGGGDIRTSAGPSNNTQTGTNVAGCTVFHEQGPTCNNTPMETDYVVGNGVSGDDSTVWVTPSHTHPSLLKNCAHYAIVEKFDPPVEDITGTLVVHATDLCLYPFFVKFKYEPATAAIRITVFDKSYSDVTAQVSLKLKTRTAATLALTYVSRAGISITRLEGSVYVNITDPSRFYLLEAPTSSSSGVAASSVQDFSAYAGGPVLIQNFDDYASLFLQNHAGEFHPANTYLFTADVQYPESALLTTNSRIVELRGVVDGRGHAIIDLQDTTTITDHDTYGFTFKNLTFRDANPAIGGILNGVNDYTIVRNVHLRGKTRSKSSALCSRRDEGVIIENCTNELRYQ